MNSGINPNFIRSCGCSCASSSGSRCPAWNRLGRGCCPPRSLLLFAEETHGPLAGAARDDLLQTHKRATANKQDVGRIHRREFLVGMLAAALRWNVGDRPFQDLQQRLLHPFTGNVSGDGGVFVLAADLVDFVDVNDALLAPLHIPVCRLQQLQDDVLHILAHITGFGQRGGVDDRERHVQDAGQRLRQQVFFRFPSDRSAECWTSESSTSGLRTLFIWIRLQWL